MNTNITNTLAGPAAPVTSGSRGIVRPGHTNSKATSIKYQPQSERYYFDVGIGSILLSGEDTGGKYCLIEAGLAPSMGVLRHTHTREDEVYYVLSGELEVTVGDRSLFLDKVILSSPRATSLTSCVILAALRTTISSCSRPPVSKGS